MCWAGWLCTCLSFTVIHKIYSYHYHSRSFSRFPFRQSNSSKNSNLWENGKLIKFSINFIFYGNLRSYRYTLDALVAPHIFSHDDYACARASERVRCVRERECMFVSCCDTYIKWWCVCFLWELLQGGYACMARMWMESPCCRNRRGRKKESNSQLTRFSSSIYPSNVFNTVFLTLIPIDIYSLVGCLFLYFPPSVRDSKISLEMLELSKIDYFVLHLVHK